eukprot:CAMPEP_0197829078 /NCGR_PEP_ID=MMETSP1437-20131217/5545_1 /TAXON_ID=49252 ORGANISM="Eucampia antarctica, Strain CCMP1452" /NCGR_SAMPLE_ID=MMETSP1437 /ASSEMBLY_ACC=CAM_ASM_001096 /LENGTH=198 /DNA_ID=CAMNT_0043430559 /DNA_START=1 /DNA_END=597 /DNA_ORIENTATION=+
MLGIPVVPKDSETTLYPCIITDDIPQTVLKLLPFMYANILQTRKITQSVTGLVRLIFEAAYPHSPPSWAVSLAGLSHDIQRDQIISEVRILYTAIDEMSENSSKDTIVGIQKILFVKEILTNFDIDKTYCGLKYVTDGNGFMWISETEVKKLEKEGELKNLIQEYDAGQAIKQQLRSKDAKIIELQNTLKEMRISKKV